MSLDKAYGEVVRQMRTEKRISQEGLAALAGLHRNFIGKIERAEQSPSLESVGLLAAALECRASDMIKAAEKLMSRDNAPRKSTG